MSMAQVWLACIRCVPALLIALSVRRYRLRDCNHVNEVVHQLLTGTFSSHSWSCRSFLRNTLKMATSATTTRSSARTRAQNTSTNTMGPLEHDPDLQHDSDVCRFLDHWHCPGAALIPVRPRPMVLPRRTISQDPGTNENDDDIAHAEKTRASLEFSKSRLEVLHTRCQHAGTNFVARLEHVENLQSSTRILLEQQLTDFAEVQRRLSVLETLLLSCDDNHTHDHADELSEDHLACDEGAQISQVDELTNPEEYKLSETAWEAAARQRQHLHGSRVQCVRPGALLRHRIPEFHRRANPHSARHQEVALHSGPRRNVVGRYCGVTDEQAMRWRCLAGRFHGSAGSCTRDHPAWQSWTCPSFPRSLLKVPCSAP